MRFALVLGVAALAAAGAPQADPAPIPGWFPDLQSGFAEAKKSGRPLMVVFR